MNNSLDVNELAPADEDEARRRLGFGTLTSETDESLLESQGAFPHWLSGTLLRSGVSMFEGDTWQMRHWFDGLAMLHAFTFDEGQVSYRSRMLRSHAYESARRTGRLTRGEFATDPCRSLFSRVASTFHPGVTDNGAVTINRLGDEFVAMTETPMPVQFDPRTLATLDVKHRAKAPGHISSAHAHRDPVGMLGFALQVGPRSTYRFYTVGASGGAQVIAETPAGAPRYVHSFGATDEHLILVLGPLVLGVGKLMTSALAGRSYLECYAWEPESGTQILVVDRRTGELVREFTTEAMFTFHHVNAFSLDADTLVADVCAYDDASILDALYLDKLRAGSPLPTGTLRRLTLDLATGTVSVQQLWGGALDLPRINYGAHNGKPYRFVYGATTTGRSPYWASGLAKVDTTTGEATVWEEPGVYPSEPVFVARPGGQAEDDGVILSISIDTADESSELTVLDARTLTLVARARVPRPIPFGFHSYHHHLPS